MYHLTAIVAGLMGVPLGVSDAVNQIELPPGIGVLLNCPKLVLVQV